MAGVHGDEWEGQAAILELWHQLPGILNRGTVYLLPAVNAEASLAGRRLSPNDGGNLNRAFLGPARGYTESVAAALEAKLLPRVQALVDDSGGASLRYLPSSVITRAMAGTRSIRACRRWRAPSARNASTFAARKPAPCRPPPAVTAC